MRRDGTNGIAGTGQIDVDGVVPVGIVPFQDRPEGLDAGIREQDVEPPESGARLLGGGAQGAKIALVKARFAPARPRGFDQTAGLRQFVAGCRYDFERRTDRSRNVDAHHVGALAGERDRRGAADPTGGAGDDGSLAQQPSCARRCRCPDNVCHDDNLHCARSDFRKDRNAVPQFSFAGAPFKAAPMLSHRPAVTLLPSA